MKTKSYLILPLIIASFCLSSCEGHQTYTLKESAGFDVWNMTSMNARASVYQSFCWSVGRDAFSYFSQSYVETDFDIGKTFFNESQNSRSVKEDAYCLQVTTDLIDESNQSNLTFNFYISHNNRYMYFDGVGSTFRSKKKMSYYFIKLICGNQYRSSN